jgi:catechol 2,3-dioxygenase-like lactoylglutathione lyase family enzyme
VADQATPNLPSRDYDKTIEFYSSLGFEKVWHDDGWLIMNSGGLMLEFFRYPDLDPAVSSFSCCLRLDDVQAFYAACIKAGVPEQTNGWPRIHAPKLEHSGMTIGYLVDLDGTLLRLVQNPK